MSMTIQEQRAALQSAQELWALLLPDVEPPDTYRFWLWASQFPTWAVMRGITRAAAKNRKMAGLSKPMTAEETARYCSSVIRNETQATPEGLL